MNEYAFMGWLVGGLSGLAALVLALKKLFGGGEERQIAPQPLLVREAEKFARVQDLESLRVELHARLEAHERRNESDMGIIRGDLGILRRGSGYVQRRVDGMTKVVYSIAGKLGVATAGAIDAEEPE